MWKKERKKERKKRKKEEGKKRERKEGRKGKKEGGREEGTNREEAPYLLAGNEIIYFRITLSFPGKGVQQNIWNARARENKLTGDKCEI